MKEFVPFLNHENQQKQTKEPLLIPKTFANVGRRGRGGASILCTNVQVYGVYTVPAPGEEYNLKSFEKSLLSSKETTL